MTRFESKPINVVLMQIVGPALIMLMVSSLVFFLVEVFYRGPHTVRLYWVMALFTFASVLVSRISIEEGQERAQLFGLALAVATLIACMQLVKFTYGADFVGSLIVMGLIATVMWSTAKLTWDCTVVDRSRDASATGLLDIVRRKMNREHQQKESDGESDGPGKIGSVIRWLSGTQQKNTPGLWVFYFGIVAFPIFGLGQWFVRVEAKSWVFVLFAIYLGSTLCLLMTTSLLGLERYLSKRKLHVPAAVATNWMLVGGTFALILVLLVLLVPKPVSNSRLQDWMAFLTTPQRNASKMAPGKDGQKDTPGARKQRLRQDAERRVDGKSGENGKNGNGDGKDEKRNNSSNSDAVDQSDKGQQNSSSANQKNSNQTDQRSAEKPTRDANRNRNVDKQQRLDQKNQADKPQNQNQNQDRNDAIQRQRRTQQNSSAMQRVLEAVSKGIQWLIYLVGAVAVCFLVWVFRHDLARLWATLFGPKKIAVEAEPKLDDQPDRSLTSYRSFNDPFRNGRVNSMRMKQVLEYTLEGLQAWTREFGVETPADETVEELTRRIRDIDGRVAKYASEFADVYGRSAFGNEKVGREELNPLIKLWRSMDSAFARRRQNEPIAAR